VVTFFALLSLYFIASFAWWHRRDHSGLRFAEPKPLGDAAIITVASEAIAGTLARNRGKVLAFGDAKVVVRAVSGHDGAPWRLVEATDFAVLPKDGMPIVVHVRAAPVVLGATSRMGSSVIARNFAAQSVALGHHVADDGDYIEIADGDEIEIVGVVDRVIPDPDHFTIDGVTRSLPRPDEGDPYRRSSGAAIVVGRATDPRITLTKL
jgi:hypothetical protein